MIVFSVRPVFSILLVTLSLLLVVFLLSPSLPFSQSSVLNSSIRNIEIWSVRRIMEWRPCKWWLEGHLTALPAKSNGYIRVDCYGGLNQMRRDFCDGVSIARLLNATLVLPKFEVAAYWNESSCVCVDEVGIDHWNELDDDYAFVYVNPEKVSKKVLVKCLVMNDKLPVDALAEGGMEPMHLEINIGDYVEVYQGTNYSAHYKNLENLIKSLDKEILSKLQNSDKPSRTYYFLQPNPAVYFFFFFGF